MSNIQSLLESAGAGWKNLQSDAVKLAAKWEKTGLLEGLKSEVERNNMSLILENQAKQLVVEQSNIQKTLEIVSRISGNQATLDEGLRRISAPVSTGSMALMEVLRAMDSQGIHALDVGLKRPSLDDVFMSLTGHAAEVEEVTK